MALGTYTQKARIESDKLDLRDYYGRPLLVKVREFRTGFTSQRFPNPKDVVIVDAVDLMAAAQAVQQGRTPSTVEDGVYIGPLWGGGAVVDNLKDNAGRDITLPVMAVKAKAARGNDYIALAALEGQAQALAEAIYQRYPNLLDEARNAREAKANPMGTFTPTPEAPAAGNAAPIQPMAPVQTVTVPQPPAQAAADNPFPAAPVPAATSQTDVAAALAQLNA